MDFAAQILPLFLTQSSAPAGTQTPCEWLIAERDAGRSLPDLVSLAESQQALFTSKDLRCLRQAGFHERVVQAAHGPTALATMAAAASEANEKAEADSVAAQQAAMADRYDVEILAAWIAPAKSDGSAWDGLSTPVSPQVIDGALALAGAGTGTAVVEATGVGDLTAFLANNALQGTSAPDVFGYVELHGPDMPTSWAGVKVSLRPPDKPMQGYYANFPGSPGYHGVKIQKGDVLRVTLYDADISQNDAIGVFDITFDDIAAASELSGSAVLHLSDRGAGQVLMCQFSAHPAANPTPSIQGQAFR